MEEQKITFGEFLKSKRLEKKMSLEDVFLQTKIRPNILEEIENENIEFFPDKLFLKSFLKSYANAVETDPNEVLDMYEQLMKESENDSNNDTNFCLRNRCLCILLIIVMALIIAGGYFLFPEQISSIFKAYTHKNEPAPLVSEKIVPSNTISHRDQKNNSIPNNNLKQKDNQKSNINKKGNSQLFNHSLILKAVDKTWLKISIDGQTPTEYILHPGDSLSLKAVEHFNLLMSNSRGVNIELDGKTIMIPEQYGNVVKLKLP